MTSVTTQPKILHVTECLAAGTLAFLAQATRELVESGVRQVLVFSRRPDTPPAVESLFDPRVELIELPGPAHSYVRYFKALRAAIAHQVQDPDCVAIHLHSSKAGFLARLALAGMRTHPPVFYSPHGLSFLDRRYLVPSLVFSALEWLAARTDCTLVGCSRGEAALLGKVGGHQARILENAVDDSFLAIQRREATPPLVISMGRACRQKAPEHFADLATRFQIAEVPARFVWIGNGEPAYEDRLRAAGVQVTGWLGREEIQNLLREASVYVQTSRWEGMPLSVLQALAAGVPCVVTNVVGNRDAVRQGITGYVVNGLDETLIAVRRLLRDDKLRRRFSMSARRDARERFSGASFRARLCRLYGLPEPGAAGSRKTKTNVLPIARRESPVGASGLPANAFALPVAVMHAAARSGSSSGRQWAEARSAGALRAVAQAPHIERDDEQPQPQGHDPRFGQIVVAQRFDQEQHEDREHQQPEQAAAPEARVGASGQVADGEEVQGRSEVPQVEYDAEVRGRAVEFGARE